MVLTSRGPAGPREAHGETAGSAGAPGQSPLSAEQSNDPSKQARESVSVDEDCRHSASGWAARRAPRAFDTSFRGPLAGRRDHDGDEGARDCGSRRRCASIHQAARIARVGKQTHSPVTHWRNRGARGMFVRPAPKAPACGTSPLHTVQHLQSPRRTSRGRCALCSRHSTHPLSVQERNECAR